MEYYLSGIDMICFEEVDAETQQLIADPIILSTECVDTLNITEQQAQGTTEYYRNDTEYFGMNFTNDKAVSYTITFTEGMIRFDEFLLLSGHGAYDVDANTYKTDTKKGRITKRYFKMTIQIGGYFRDAKIGRAIYTFPFCRASFPSIPITNSSFTSPQFTVEALSPDLLNARDALEIGFGDEYTPCLQRSAPPVPDTTPSRQAYVEGQGISGSIVYGFFPNGNWYHSDIVDETGYWRIDNGFAMALGQSVYLYQIEPGKQASITITHHVGSGGN